MLGFLANIFETPHPTSYLGHLLPREKEVIPCPLPWGEGVGHAPTGEGSLTVRCGLAALRYLADP
jgi:hypothetical protein